MAGLKATVDRGFGADITVVAVEGDLGLTTVATVRLALAKALVECPVAIIVDLTHCHVISPAALVVFPWVARGGISRPAVLIAIAGLTTAAGSTVPAALGAIPTFTTVAAARQGIGGNVVVNRRASHSVQPTPAAPQHAAAAIEQACREWGLRHLCQYAARVGHDLMHRALRSAEGTLHCDIILRGDFLHLRVIHEQGPQPGAMPRRVEAETRIATFAEFTSAWGHVTDLDDGASAFWATMPVRPELRAHGSTVEDGVDGTLLDIRATPDNGALRVSLAGEIDLNVADQLTDVLIDEVPPEDDLIVDFAKVTFCDSAGITAMIKLRNHLAEAGRAMSLIHMSEAVRRVFELAGLVECLDIRS